MENLFVDLEANLATLFVNAGDVVVQGCTSHLQLFIMTIGFELKGDHTDHDVAAVDLGQCRMVPVHVLSTPTPSLEDRCRIFDGTI